MKLFAQKHKVKKSVVVLFPIVFFLIIIIVFANAFSNSSVSTAKEQQNITKRAFERAVITCYATEGTYPQDSEYVEKNYGVYVDHDLYVVNYTFVGANVRPEVDILIKGK